MIVKDILEEIGYTLTDTGEYYRTAALYRGGDNRTALSVNKNTGMATDFKMGKTMSLKQLVSLTTGIDEDDLEWEDFEVVERIEEKVKTLKVFKLDEFPSRKDYSYWTNRGLIDTTILDILDNRVYTQGYLWDRSTFPIKDARGKIIGYSGRALNEKAAEFAKWKHMGEKKQWLYPIHYDDIHGEILRKGYVILVESIGDFLALYEAGYKNCLVCFGGSGGNILNPQIMKYILGHNLRVVISFNNGEIGIDFCKSANRQLIRYIDERKISTVLPALEDWGLYLGNPHEIKKQLN